jgi:hypothetical protein
MHTTMYYRDQRVKIPKAPSMFLALWALVPLCQNILQLIGRQRRVLSGRWFAASVYQNLGSNWKCRRLIQKPILQSLHQPLWASNFIP